MMVVKEINPIEVVDFGQDIADVGRDVLDSLFSLEQNVILIILIIMAVTGLTITFIQWQRVKIRNNIVSSKGYHYGSFNERLTSHEAKTEYAKLEKLLMDIEKKDRKLREKTNKNRVCKSQKTNHELENGPTSKKDYN
jgi:hypothetical protein